MGIIQTDQWLQKELNHPMKICERLIPYFDKQNASGIYQQLLRFGMYKPSMVVWNTFEKMEEDHTWDKIRKVYHKYKAKWLGPDIPVFLFPIDQAGIFFRRSEKNKSGVSFEDKMFLFLSEEIDEKEMEALFVHEYHHVCRLNRLNRNLENYTLLDSMIIEGLAEYTVLRNCGNRYLADWCRKYSEQEIDFFWNKFLKYHLTARKNEKIHDDLLYGHGRLPKLAGYAAGYSIVSDYYLRNRFSVERSFSLPAERFISGTKYQKG